MAESRRKALKLSSQMLYEPCVKFLTIQLLMKFNIECHSSILFCEPPVECPILSQFSIRLKSHF